MIYPGTDLKYRITSEVPGFSLDTDNFMVQVVDRYGRVRHSISKDECFQDSESQWYFTVEGLKTGVYYARFRAYLPDGDYNKLYRVFTDEQPLCVIGFCEQHAPHMRDCDKDQHQIHYEQVWTTELDDGTYLADKDGNLILTNEGSRIQIKKKSTI